MPSLCEDCGASLHPSEDTLCWFCEQNVLIKKLEQAYRAGDGEKHRKMLAHLYEEPVKITAV